MRVLTAVLAAVVTFSACGGGDPPGPEGSTREPCGQYVLEQTRAYEPGDQYIPGVITVGLAKGMTGPEAATFLKALDTTYYLPLPFREYAVVCVAEGHEDAWIETIRGHTEEVEWAHREGVRPLEAAERD